MSEHIKAETDDTFQVMLQKLDMQIASEMERNAVPTDVALSYAPKARAGEIESKEGTQLLVSEIHRATLVIRELMKQNIEIRQAAEAFETSLRTELESERAEAERLRSEMVAMKEDRDIAYQALDRERYSVREARQSAEHLRFRLSEVNRLLEDKNNFLRGLMSMTDGLRETLEDAEQLLTNDTTEGGSIESSLQHLL